MAERGLAQWQLAKKVGVKPSTLSDYLRGARPAPESLESEVEHALHLSPGTLTSKEQR
ncbi:MAG: helix-turn-helix transcriptional regulator [Anaeromyxobacter sp.]|nr:helix-turn-helix transcriptional regulator [Anaeromyxobacter sp.]